MPELLGQIELFLENDRTMSLKELALKAGLSVGTIHHALKDKLHLAKHPARWVAHHLTAAQKQRRQAICEQLNDDLIEDINILERIVTCDESWFFTYDPACHQATSSWWPKSATRPHKPRLDRYCPKVMMVAFFDANGLIHWEFVPHGAGVTGELYIEILKRFHVAMARKRPQLWKDQNFVLQQDGAPVHRCDATTRFMTRNNMITLPHPGYSPDLAPCDYWFFARIKKHTKGHCFDSVDELCRRIDGVIKSIPPEEYHHAIYDLPARWIKCSEAEGAYFE